MSESNWTDERPDDVITDEAYIDDLFAREGIGWDKTPGFRAFVLDLMGIIGERPRAGDVSSMHLAYTAGLEYGKEWTDERPTEPGEYWVSLHPNRRTVAASYPVGLERPVERVWVEGGLCVHAAMAKC